MLLFPYIPPFLFYYFLSSERGGVAFLCSRLELMSQDPGEGLTAGALQRLDRTPVGLVRAPFKRQNNGDRDLGRSHHFCGLPSSCL